MKLPDTWTFPSLHLLFSLVVLSCHLSLRGAFFTDSREHECHNALKSLISLPSCHLAPPRALPLCLPVGFAVCLDVCLSVSLSEGLSKLCFPPAITGLISLRVSWQADRHADRRARAHTHVNQVPLLEKFSCFCMSRLLKSTLLCRVRGDVSSFQFSAVSSVVNNRTAQANQCFLSIYFVIWLSTTSIQLYWNAYRQLS